MAHRFEHLAGASDETFGHRVQGPILQREDKRRPRSQAEINREDIKSGGLGRKSRCDGDRLIRRQEMIGNDYRGGDHGRRGRKPVPPKCFADKRVMRASPRDLYDALTGTFEYLVENEPIGLLMIVMHCQFGGRPLITAMLQDVLKYVTASPSCWMARHEELASWALARDTHELLRSSGPSGQSRSARPHCGGANSSSMSAQSSKPTSFL
jgi:hypothetical protein